MIRQMPFDRLNTLTDSVKSGGYKNVDDIIDEIIEIAVISYLNGVADVNDMLSTDVAADVASMEQAINKRYDGRDLTQDIERYFASNDAAGLILVAETTSHRAYVSGELDAAISGGVAQTKTWDTMRDDRVRDTHDYLQGQTIPIGADFYTYTGARASAPGLFGIAEEDCNCRCRLTFN